MFLTDQIAKYSVTVILPVLIFGGALCSAGFAAQRADSTWRDMEYIRQTDVWLTSRNAAGLKSLPVKGISEVSLSANKSDGSFVNYHQSDNSYTTLGARAESFYRLNPDVVFSAGIAYSNFKGKNMGGSVFIDPYQNPIDIADYTDDNRGTRQLEQYDLSGAVSARLDQRFTLGVRITYLAANYAKTRDLRHVNALLDMDVSAGAAYEISPVVELGASYDYRRRVESLRSGVYGNTDRQYLSLISFGSFFGRAEVFSDLASYTGQMTPMVNNAHNAALQLKIRISQRISLFNELSVGQRKGYFGERGTNKVVLTENENNTGAYRGGVAIRTERSLHTIELKGSYESVSNMENIHRPVTVPGEAASIVYYGQSERLDASVVTAFLGYTANLQVVGDMPLWVFKAGMNYYSREQTVSLYPFYRKQQINSYRFSFLAKKTIISNKDLFGISVAALLGSGGGMAKNDGYYAVPSESQALPATFDLYLYREYEYLTSSRAGGSAGLRYARSFGKGLTPYVQTDYAYTRAFNTAYTGRSFSNIQLTLGCTF